MAILLKKSEFQGKKKEKLSIYIWKLEWNHYQTGLRFFSLKLIVK